MKGLNNADVVILTISSFDSLIQPVQKMDRQILKYDSDYAKLR